MKNDFGAANPWFFPTWSIGIFCGDSPIALQPEARAANPVITSRDITDLRAEFVADPFIQHVNGIWHMFFEVMDQDAQKGVIGLALSSDSLLWSYQQLVLKEAFHLSYPYVFEWQGTWYMLPETLEPNAVRLYKAVDFPTNWVYIADLIRGQFADPTIFRHQDIWWLFVCPLPGNNDALQIYFADQLLGPWHSHPLNPLVKSDPYHARPAGRVTSWDGRLIRYAQTCWPLYGVCVRAIEILRLSRSEYLEKELDSSPILNPSGAGWNASGMHHLDPHQHPDGHWVASVDGFFGDTSDSG